MCRFGDGLYNLVKIIVSFCRTLQSSRQLADDPEELHRKGRSLLCNWPPTNVNMCFERSLAYLV